MLVICIAERPSRPPVIMPKPTTRKCAALACKRHISYKKLMCDGHWNLVTHDRKKALLEHYVLGQDKSGTITPEYRLAVADAVKQIAFREGFLVKAEPETADDGRGGADEYDNPE
jgi:hypothetical protein